MSFQTSLSEALDSLNFQGSTSEHSLHLPSDVGFGEVSIGGFVACVMQRYALYYASQHPRMQEQTDLRSAYVNLHRPILPSQDQVTMKLYEISIGKGWSTLRVEMLQKGKLCASSCVIVSNLSLPGLTLSTGWDLYPPPHRVNLAKLETHSDPGWTCYQTAFYAKGFRRGHSYVKNFVPTHLPRYMTHTEQWIAPGWDCTPTGSRDPSLPEARWTSSMIQFAAGIMMPVQENFIHPGPDKPAPHASVAATLGFGAAQMRAKDEERLNWRELADDGSMTTTAHLVHVTMTMSTEVKRKLPEEGVRWLYLRSEAKSIINGRMDLEVLIFDEGMELIAICNQVAQIVPALEKNQRKASL